MAVGFTFEKFASWGSKRPLRFYFGGMIALLMIQFAACGNADRQSSKLHLLVASSAMDATMNAIEAWAARHEFDSSKVVVVAGSSSSLAQQISAGAPADIFISASPQWSDAVSDQCRVTRVFTSNRLVLATHSSNPKRITSIDDLEDERVEFICAAGRNVPVGHYAGQFVDQLEDPLRSNINSKLVFGKDASSLVVWLENQEADAGFVYASDVHRSTAIVAVATIDSNLHEPITYSISRVANDRQADDEACETLFRWLQSSEAKSIFREHGFQPPEPLPSGSTSTKVGP